MTQIHPHPDAWWRSAVIYQVYPRSFRDGNGDGVGDLAGIRAGLDHIAGLGADAIWLSPFYRSPQADAGYDVSDYCDVDPVFGTLDEFRLLVAEAHQRNLRLIVDIVPNHTSSEHPWFVAALADAVGGPARERYLFRPGAGPDGSRPPNNWMSNFGGPAWTRLPDGQWYLHLFAKEQPDLNWTHPEVIAAFQDILRFWLDIGVDGFRIDAAHGLVKDPDLPDSQVGHLLLPENTGDHPHWDRDEIHDVYRGWRSVLDAYGDDRVFVGEVCVPNQDRFARYLRADELHTAFNFAFLEAGWRAADFRAAVDRTVGDLAAVGAPATWVLSNHDVVRHVTRFGGGEIGRRRARAALLLTLALPGGAYLYQGEELGLDEVDVPVERRLDPMFFRSEGASPGRDGCRVPLPWSGDAAPFGFSLTPAAPWLPQPAGWAGHTVADQDADPASVLSFYRSATAARRTRRELGDGPMAWADAPDGVLAFTRGPGSFACLVNFTDADVACPGWVGAADVVLASAPSAPGALPANSAVWLARG